VNSDQRVTRNLGDLLPPTRGLLRACQVTRDIAGDGIETLVLIATPDLDLVEACAEIGLACEESWPAIVVLAPNRAGGGPGADEDVLIDRVERVTHAAETVELRKAFLRMIGDVLGCAAVADDDYFFLTVEGDSVRALQLSAAVEEEFGFELPLEILVTLTVGRIADLVATACVAFRADVSADGG
jgi:acyl carrier protein